MKPIFQRILFYFFQGLLFIVPITATIYVVVQVFRWIDNIIPFDIPGLGILMLFVSITFFGILSSTILAEPLKNYFEYLIGRAPILKTIYNATTDLMAALVGQKKNFTEPVLVRLDKDGMIFKPGFITQKDLSMLGLGSEMVAVYLPHSYAFSGNMFIVPAQNVKPIPAKASDVMKFIVSGGVSMAENNATDDTKA
jgi:uncharacterized membrane protein